MSSTCMIVDDEPLAREVLVKYIGRCPLLALEASCSSAYEAMEFLDKTSVAIIFLDINMPGLSGLSMIRSLDRPPEIIFTTAYPEYAVEGFELDAADYLVKPFSYERFLKAVNKALKRFGNRNSPVPESAEQKKFLLVKADGRIFQVEHASIACVEAMGDYVRIHTDSGVITAYETMKNMECLLPEDQFLRVHRSFLVALGRISFLEGNMLRVGDRDVPVGQSYRERLMNRMG
jgi:two-component system LytT family response regulator